MKTTITLSQLETRVSDIFHMAKVCHWTADKLGEQLIANVIGPINSRTKYGGRRRFSVYMSGYASGLIAASRNDIWRSHVEFCYRDSDGVLYSTHNQSTHKTTEVFYTSGRGSELGKLECAHVWMGTDKPYTDWKVM